MMESRLGLFRNIVQNLSKVNKTNKPENIPTTWKYSFKSEDSVSNDMKIGPQYKKNRNGFRGKTLIRMSKFSKYYSLGKFAFYVNDKCKT